MKQYAQFSLLLTLSNALLIRDSHTCGVGMQTGCLFDIKALLDSFICEPLDAIIRINITIIEHLLWTVTVHYSHILKMYFKTAEEYNELTLALRRTCSIVNLVRDECSV